MGDADGAVRIDIECGEVIFERDFGERAASDDTGVVDQHVDAADPRIHKPPRLGDTLLTRHVHLDPHRRVPATAQPTRGRVDSIGILFADCAAQVEPCAARLAEIARLAGANCEIFLQESPRVAPLPHCTKGSASGTRVRKAQEALGLCQDSEEFSPGTDWRVDGELQLDAAIVQGILWGKTGGSPLLRDGRCES